MNFGEIGTFAQSHPVAIGVGVFAIGGLFLLMRGRSSAPAPNTAGVDSYFAAQAAQSQAGAAIQIATLETAAQTAQTKTLADASVANNTTWANADVSMTQSNNQASMAAAPYAFESQLVDALATVAATPGTVTTSKSSGFFGIGGGSKQNVTFSPASIQAGNLLSSFANGFYPGH